MVDRGLFVFLYKVLRSEFRVSEEEYAVFNRAYRALGTGRLFGMLNYSRSPSAYIAAELDCARPKNGLIRVPFTITTAPFRLKNEFPG